MDEHGGLRSKAAEAAEAAGLDRANEILGQDSEGRGQGKDEGDLELHQRVDEVDDQIRSKRGKEEPVRSRQPSLPPGHRSSTTDLRAKADVERFPLALGLEYAVEKLDDWVVGVDGRD